MSFLAAAIATAGRDHDHEIPLTLNEALSGIFGSVSLACWLFLLVPQLVENYRNQSAEAISLAFVIVWFLGDVSNLLGALLANLVPTVILIAIYFCISDGLLIGQVLYYGIRNKRRQGAGLLESMKDTVVRSERGTDRGTSEVRGSVSTVNDLEREPSAQETEPLLSRKHSRGNSYSTYTIPGSADAKAVREQLARRRSSSGSQVVPGKRRKSSTAAALSAQQEPLAKIFEESDTEGTTQSTTVRVFKNAAFIFGVVLVGTIGWLVAYKTGTWQPTPPEDVHANSFHTSDDSNSAGAQFLGYASAALYLTARLPQIWKNYREQSCEGLSILFFILSLLGNATYGAGILAHSNERTYVTKNIPWLLGSLGTIFEDMIVFYQFRLYKDNTEEQAVLPDPAPASGLTARGQGQSSTSTVEVRT